MMISPCTQACYDNSAHLDDALVGDEVYTSNGVPYPHGFDDRMMIFDESVTPRDVNNIQKLGYAYSSNLMESGTPWADLGHCKYQIPWGPKRPADSIPDDINIPDELSFGMEKKVMERGAMHDANRTVSHIVDTVELVPTKPGAPPIQVYTWREQDQFDLDFGNTGTLTTPEESERAQVKRTVKNVYIDAVLEAMAKGETNEKLVMKRAARLECETYGPYGPLDKNWAAFMRVDAAGLPCTVEPPTVHFD